jgi:16S rRNA (guanine527-N7)-methyltransferase
VTLMDLSLLAQFDVSRETEERLLLLQESVIKWNRAINLVSKSSMDDIFVRHIIDSAQIFALAGVVAGTWADLGSGGGFPGLVVACLAAEKTPELKMVLVESDQRKSAFLRSAAQRLKLQVDVRSERIETMVPIGANVVSARALAPLPQLCAYVSRHISMNGIALLHKGANREGEIAGARQQWNFQMQQIQSITDPTAVILKLEGLTHV